MTSAGRIIVAGTLAGVGGQAGASWAVLQYVLGLRELGHDVWVVEPVASVSGETRRAFDRLVSEFGLEDRAALLVGESRTTVGAPYASVRQACATADALLNLSGVLHEPDLLERCALRAYLDLDPAFNQLWHEAGIDRGFAAHTHHFTVGAAIGTPGCDVPACGITWRATLPPVVLSHWRPLPPEAGGAFTTVGNWRSYGSVQAGGVFYGQKAHSLRRLIELPRRSGERFLLAMSIHRDEVDDLRALADNGWTLVDPGRVAGTASAYRGFIARSKGELGLAKAGYVTSGCGWFSDRSACYLATGRPVVAHDTGLGSSLPVGTGLLTFRTCEDAAAAVDAVACDYKRHARGASALAHAHLDSRLVLGTMLDQIGAR